MGAIHQGGPAPGEREAKGGMRQGETGSGISRNNAYWVERDEHESDDRTWAARTAKGSVGDEQSRGRVDRGADP